MRPIRIVRTLCHRPGVVRTRVAAARGTLLQFPSLGYLTPLLQHHHSTLQQKSFSTNHNSSGLSDLSNLLKLEKATSNIQSSLEQICESGGSPHQAEFLLRQVEKLSSTVDDLPSTRDYNRVLDLYVDANLQQEAHDLVCTMKQIPNEVSFLIVAQGWIQCGELHRAESLLKYFCKQGLATSTCFNLVISQFATKKSLKAVQYMHSMYEYSQQQHPEAKPNKITLTNVMKLLMARKEPLQAEELLRKMWQTCDKDMMPDAITYSQVFSAYSKANRPDGVERCQRLLQDMHRHYQETKDLSVKPNTVVMNSYLSVVAAAGDGPQAEAFLKKMLVENVEPSIVTYGTVLKAWKNHGNALKALEFLWKIPNPDRPCFTITLDALAGAGEGEKAEAVLRHMYETGRPELRPQSQTYTAVLRAWVKSSHEHAFENAKRVFGEMERLQQDNVIVLETFDYNQFLMAIARSSTVSDKVKEVKRVLEQMNQSNATRPNFETSRLALYAIQETQGDEHVQKNALQSAMELFESLTPRERAHKGVASSMMQVCAKLSPKGVNGANAVVKVFHYICKEGILQPFDLVSLRKAASDEFLFKLFQTTDREARYHLPDSWSRNRNRVAQKQRRPAK